MLMLIEFALGLSVEGESVVRHVSKAMPVAPAD